MSLLSYLYSTLRADGDMLIKKHWSLRDKEELEPYRDWRVSKLIRLLESQTPILMVCWAPNHIIPALGDDGMNAFTVLRREPGKRGWTEIGRSLQGQGSADVLDYWQRHNQDCFVRIQ